MKTTDCIYAVFVCFLFLPQASVPCIRSSPVPSDPYTGLSRQYEIITMLHTLVVLYKEIEWPSNFSVNILYGFVSFADIERAADPFTRVSLWAETMDVVTAFKLIHKRGGRYKCNKRALVFRDIFWTLCPQGWKLAYLIVRVPNWVLLKVQYLIKIQKQGDTGANILMALVRKYNLLSCCVYNST